MRFEIRRNRDLVMNFTCNAASMDVLKSLMPERTKEEIRMSEEANEHRRFVESEMWDFVKNVNIVDLDGRIISPETHEIGYDWGEPDSQGMRVAECMWIRPKESEMLAKRGGGVKFGPEEVKVIWE